MTGRPETNQALVIAQADTLSDYESSWDNLRGFGDCFLWMIVPLFLTAMPTLVALFSSEGPRAIERHTFICWVIGMIGSVFTPAIAGILHRSRGIAYICGIIGGVTFFIVGFLSYLAIAVST